MYFKSNAEYVNEACTNIEDYDYKLNAYELTKKTVLMTLHPDLQKYLNEAGSERIISVRTSCLFWTNLHLCR